MKKFLALFLVIIMALPLVSCGKKGEECVLLFENTDGVSEVTVNYDLDEDGAPEEINVRVDEDWFIEVKVGYSEIYLAHGEGYYIDKIYAIDLDAKKNGKELVLITEEVSSDMMLRVLKPEGDEFKLYEFQSVDEYSGNAYLWDTLNIGYEPSVEYDGDTLRTSQRGRCGMWCVEAEYKFDGEKFTEVEMNERDVVRSSYAWSELVANDLESYDIEGYFRDETEIENLKAGYATAYADFVNYGDVPEHSDMTELKAGDAFKVTKEDNEGFVYIEKKSGEAGWIYMGDFMDNRYDVSEKAFFLAD